MDLKFTKLNREIKRFQAGGEMGAPEAGAPGAGGAPAGAPAGPEGGAPAGPEGGQDPMQQILQAAMQAVQANDGQLALQVCAALVQLAQGAMGGGGPQPAAEEPVYRAGGKLAYRRK